MEDHLITWEYAKVNRPTRHNNTHKWVFFEDYICSMAQKKVFRFGQIKSFPNVWEYPENAAGTWHHKFNNQNPIVLELACGRGEYTVGLAKLNKTCNYIGVDVKGNRMYIGAKEALQQNLGNAAFLRTQIEMIDTYFAPGEVSEIWITFPDPQLRTSKAKKRLTHPRFLRAYHKFLKPGGLIHLKTDSPALYKFTKTVADLYDLNILKDNQDVYGCNPNPELSIKTYYESLDIARSSRIHYLQFSLPEVMADRDFELKEILLKTENTGVESA